MKKLGCDQGDDDADELVAGVGDEVEELGLVGDGQDVGAELQRADLEDDDHEGGGGGEAEEFGVEGAAEAGEERGEQDVGDEGHDGDVHVGAVDVLAWREEEGRGGGCGEG